MRLFSYLGALIVAMVFATTAQAQVTFQLRTGDATTGNQSMAIDSNKCGTEGPRSAFVGGLVTNTSAATVNNIAATISGLGNGFFLAGGQQATQSIGSLDSGQSTAVYWFIGYGCTDGAVTSPTITITSGGSPVTANLTLTGREAISANAGGSVVSSLLGPGAVVGQTIYFDATYSFGGSNIGDEYFVQPSGGQAFDAACFRLVSSRIMSSGVTALTVGQTDQMYFVASQKQTGSGHEATVRYFFEYQCAGSTTTARPYAVQTSGSSNIKYTGNFDGAGSVSIAFPGASNPFTITKSSDVSIAPGVAPTIVKYTVAITNPSAYDSRISQFTDTLPAGVSFLGLDAASDVTAANSSSVPVVGATGTLSFNGRVDQSYLIAGGATVRLIYSALVPITAGTYANSAQGHFGQALTPTATATVTVVAPVPLTVVKSSQPSIDPFNGSTNPKAIPGARLVYSVSLSNPNPFEITADSLMIIDVTPANLRFFANDIGASGSGPILFQDGGVASMLTYTFTSLSSITDDLEFSNDGGATWSYFPVPNGQGEDLSVTHVRIMPKGSMAANSSFNLSFAYVVE